jgi:hypothetical protein
MSQLEYRLIKDLWRIMFGTFSGLTRQDDPQAYDLLARTFHWNNAAITDTERRQLARLGWQHRAQLDPELAVACALKGGASGRH